MRLLEAALWVAVGGAVVLLLLVGSRRLEEGQFREAGLAGRTAGRLLPWVFVGPAAVVLAVTLVAPTVRTVYLAFHDRRGETFVGLANFDWALTAPEIRTVLVNNGFWIVGVTGLSLLLGTLFALATDRMRGEQIIKSLVFMPMALSAVSASIIWRFVYAFRPGGSEQIGLLNQLVVLAGGDPRGWLIEAPLNTFLLIMVMTWMQTGFAMVVLSAAVKSVPEDLLEAAQIDGATPVQSFRHVTIPHIRPTLGVVTAVTIVFVVKVFDIVKVMTNGQFDTDVLANAMFTQAFVFRDVGRGAVLAVVLLAMVLPFIVVQSRRVLDRRPA